MSDVTEASLAQLSLDSVLEIAEFANTAAFQVLLAELYALPYEERDEFVRSVLLDPVKLAERSVEVPAGLTIQRSRFHDGRPTIFCISKVIGGDRRKVTITFDRELDAEGSGRQREQLPV